MVGPPKRRSSTITVPKQPDVEDEADSETRNPFAPPNTGDTSDESGVSEYGKNRKRTAIKKQKQKKQQQKKQQQQQQQQQPPPPKRKSMTKTMKPGRAPSAPDMSDIEYDRSSDSPELGDCIEVRKHSSTPNTRRLRTSQLTVHTRGAAVTPRASAIPHVVQIHLDAGAAAGGTTINLDLSDLVLGKRPWDESGVASLPTPDGSTAPTSPTRIVINNATGHIRAATPGPSSKRIRTLASVGRPSSRPPPTGFCDLPYEIRIRIYRQVFVTEAPIDLASRDNFARSSAFLRTCRLVHLEGRAVLYGENAFHFERSAGTRGTFFEATWKEIGFKDARRFLETIGPANIALMRYLSFHFQDAAPSTTPHLDENERRFVHDPVLHHLLRLVGASARLAKIAFQFSGRKLLQKVDYAFLQALASIKAEEVIHAERMTYAPSKVGDAGIVDKLKKVMTVPRADDAAVDVAKKKAPTVKMFHERPRAFDYYGGRW